MVQSGLDQKKVVVVVPELSLEADQLAAILHLKPEISPDGRYLAAPRPGTSPAVVIVRLDLGTVVKTLEGARSPSWAPDGLRLLFVMESQDSSGKTTRTLHVLNRDLGSARPVATDLVLLDAPPIWSLDGQSILAVAQPPPALARNFQVDLYRISFDVAPTIRMINLEAVATAPLRNRVGGRLLLPRGNLRTAPAQAEPPVVVQSTLSLDRDQEECIALIELSGQAQAFKWCNVRSQRVSKLMHPLDIRIGIGAPAISPDGQTVAFRAMAPGMLGLPAFCDLNTEEITLIAPDASTRRVWLELLASCSADILKLWLEPKVGRQPAVLATILPSPIELAGDNPLQGRLRHLANIARGLLDQPRPDDLHNQPTPRETAARDELRLFFDYLRGDFKGAEARLDTLEAHTDDPTTRLRWLCVRARSCSARARSSARRGISAYLARTTKPRSHAIEQTPAGPVVTTIADPEAEWAAQLAQSLSPEALARSEGGLGMEPADGQGIDASNAIELDTFSGRAIRVQPQFRFAPGTQGEAVEGFDPARFGGRMLVAPPGPAPDPPVLHNPPGLPRL